MIFKSFDVAGIAGRFADFLDRLYEDGIRNVAELEKFVGQTIVVDADKNERVVVSQPGYRRLEKAIFMEYTTGKEETDVPISIVFKEESNLSIILVKGHFALSDYDLSDYHVIGSDNDGNTMQNKMVNIKYFREAVNEIRSIQQALPGDRNSSGKNI